MPRLNLPEPGTRALHDQGMAWKSTGRAPGKSNIDAVERIVQSKCQRGPAFNRRHPFVDVLLADIIERGKVLDTCRPIRQGTLGLNRQAGNPCP